MLERKKREETPCQMDGGWEVGKDAEGDNYFNVIVQS